MRNIYIIIIIVMLAVVIAVLTGCGEPRPTPRRFKIFRDTPVWELAQAVQDNDIDRIDSLVIRDSVDINYQDPEFGYTLLMTALLNHKGFFSRGPLSKVRLGTIEELLKLGADPNLSGDSLTQRGVNAVIVACDQNWYDGLRLLLKYGGDPNTTAYTQLRFYNRDETALMAATYSVANPDDTRCMELLLESGADVNATTKSSRGGILTDALPDYKRVLILLEHGADSETKVYSYHVDSLISLPEQMRYHDFPLNSEDYRYKRKVIDFLKRKGIDYYSYPIPEKMMEEIKKRYPLNWRRYAEVY